MKKLWLPALFAAALAFAETDVLKDKGTDLSIFPIEHASMVITAGQQVVYVDPVGAPELFQAHGKPTLILVTDIHKDHMDKDALDKLRTDRTRIWGPQAVIDFLGYGRVMNNGENLTDGEILVEAMPMYNTTPDRMKRHPQGRGNGYLLTYKGKRVYISGDTEDIPEMRALKNVDYAFVCMNLPTTMSVEQAASAVLEFKPKTVIPYHHRWSDIRKFQALVNEGDANIKVVRLEWYPNGENPPGS